MCLLTESQISNITIDRNIKNSDIIDAINFNPKPPHPENFFGAMKCRGKCFINDIYLISYVINYHAYKKVYEGKQIKNPNRDCGEYQNLSQTHSTSNSQSHGIVVGVGN